MRPVLCAWVLEGDLVAFELLGQIVQLGIGKAQVEDLFEECLVFARLPRLEREVRSPR